jgi:hypothetical protein
VVEFSDLEYNALHYFIATLSFVSGNTSFTNLSWGSNEVYP